MSAEDVSPYEMSRFSGMSHEDFERLLAGQGPAGDEAIEDVERFVRDVWDAYPGRAVAHSVETEHLAAMMHAAGPLAHEGGPVVRPTRDGLARLGPGRGSRRRNRVKTPDVKRRLLRSPVGRVAAVLVAMFTIFSGVALAGVLPAPVQKAVSDVAGSVGIHVPSPADDDEVGDDQDADDQGEDDDAVVPQPGTHDREEADDQDDPGDDQDADDQGEDADDQSEDADDQGEDADDQGDAQAGDDQGEDADDQGEDEQSGSDEGDESEHHSGPSGSGEDRESNDEGDGQDGDGSRGSEDEGESHEGSDGGSGGSSGGDQGDDEGESEE